MFILVRLPETELDLQQTYEYEDTTTNTFNLLKDNLIRYLELSNL